MHYQTLDSEKYFTEPIITEPSKATNLKKSLTSTCQFVVAVGVIVFIVNYSDQVGNLALQLQNGITQLIP